MLSNFASCTIFDTHVENPNIYIVFRMERRGYAVFLMQDRSKLQVLRLDCFTKGLANVAGEQCPAYVGVEARIVDCLIHIKH